MNELRVVPTELIVGSDEADKLARARRLADIWCARAAENRAVYIAASEAPVELAHAIGPQGRADTLVTVDCLTLWLTAMLLPAAGASLADVIALCKGPLVLIG